jgi:1-acyl-sn-glycerol-3-phosphate acyltransferase
VIRSLWVGLNLFVATVSLSAVVIGSALLRVRGPVYGWAARRWSRWTLAASGVRVRLEGLENLDPEQAKIIASNHASWYDVWALAAYIPGLYRFVAKKELANIPIFGAAWKAAGHISVDRDDRQSAIRSLRAAGDKMRAEKASVVIFPEGTRSSTGELLPFKKGAFMLALHTGVDIVPTAVLGGRQILPKGAWRVRRGTIIVRFGTPIASDGYDEDNRDELIGRVRTAIETMLHAPTNDGMPSNV